MKDREVNILGTTYHILYRSIAEDDLLKNSDGYVDRTTKKIVIGNKESDCEVQDFKSYQKKVTRHEIIHAYFEESGLSVNVENLPNGVPEMYVDWFAIQGPKIYKTFIELDILDAPIQLNTPLQNHIVPKKCDGCFGAADTACKKCEAERPNVPIHDMATLIDLAGTTALMRGMNSDVQPTELIALMHAEVSEILEEFKAGHEATETYYANGKPEGVPSELADVVIYCFIMADLYKIDLEKALIEKMEFNKTRPPYKKVERILNYE